MSVSKHRDVVIKMRFYVHMNWVDMLIEHFGIWSQLITKVLWTVSRSMIDSLQKNNCDKLTEKIRNWVMELWATVNVWSDKRLSDNSLVLWRSENWNRKSRFFVKIEIVIFAKLLLRFFLQQLMDVTGLNDVTIFVVIVVLIHTLAEVVGLQHSAQ